MSLLKFVEVVKKIAEEEIVRETAIVDKNGMRV